MPLAKPALPCQRLFCTGRDFIAFATSVMVGIHHRGSKSFLAAACVAVSLALPTSGHALQVLDVRDGVAVEAILSIKEPTRIRIDGTAITDVFGSIQSSNCGLAPTVAGLPGGPGTAGSTTPVGVPGGPGAAGSAGAFNPAGEIALECDRDKGEIYVRPTATSSNKPINLFIASSQATYTLILRRADTPADTIVLRDRSQGASRGGSASASRPVGPLGPLGTSANPVRALKALLVSMAQGTPPADAEVTEPNQPIRLWKEASFVLVRRIETRGLVGEVYVLKNTSTETLVLAEQEFDRSDSDGGALVLGVSVENHNLLPGQSTSVFVISRSPAAEGRP